MSSANAVASSTVSYGIKCGQKVLSFSTFSLHLPLPNPLPPAWHSSCSCLRMHPFWSLQLYNFELSFSCRCQVILMDGVCLLFPIILTTLFLRHEKATTTPSAHGQPSQGPGARISDLRAYPPLLTIHLCTAHEVDIQGGAQFTDLLCPLNLNRGHFF